MTLTNEDANSKIVDVVADIDVEESESFVTTDSLLADCCREGNDFNKVAYA